VEGEGSSSSLREWIKIFSPEGRLGNINRLSTTIVGSSASGNGRNESRRWSSVSSCLETAIRPVGVFLPLLLKRR